MKAVDANQVHSTDFVQLAAFRVGEENYAVDIMRVREVMRWVPLTAVRHGPHTVDGILTLRGMIVPVVCLRRRFNLPATDSHQRRIIVVITQARHLGLLVDSMTEVVRVLRQDLQPAPKMLNPQVAPFFSGACQLRQTTLLLLNLNHLVDAPALPMADVTPKSLTP